MKDVLWDGGYVYKIWLKSNNVYQKYLENLSVHQNQNLPYKPQTGFEPTASDLARIVIFRNSLILTKNIVKIVKLVCFKPKFVHITIIKC